MIVIGFDLAGSPLRNTGFAIMRGKKIETWGLHTDEEILRICHNIMPRIVAIDAPLSMPKYGNLRKADKDMIRRGLRVFPPTFPGMISLTHRGIQISSSLRSAGLSVIEVHPRSSGVILFGSSTRDDWIGKIRKMGYSLKGTSTKHEIDACIGAITGYMYLRGKTEKFGCPEEGEIVVPSAPLYDRHVFRNCRNAHAGDISNPAQR